MSDKEGTVNIKKGVRKLKYKYSKIICTSFLFIFLLTPLAAFNAELYDSYDEGKVFANVPVKIETKLSNTTYTVEIPAELSFEFMLDDDEPVLSDTFEITVSDIKNLRDKKISVSIMPDTGEFVLKHDSDSLPYTIKYENREISAEDEVIAFINEPTTMKFQVSVDPKDIKKASVYSGFLQFFFSVED